MDVPSVGGVKEYLIQPVPETRDVPRAGGTGFAFINFCKAMFGAGILGLPHAFTKSGLWAGLSAYVALGIMVFYTMVALLKVKREGERVLGVPVTTYADVTSFAFGRAGRIVGQVTVIALPITFCSGFLIVVLANVEDLYPHVPYIRLYAGLGLVPAVTLLAWIRYLKYFWIPSLLGLGVYVFGVMFTTFYYGIKVVVEDDIDSGVEPAVWSSFPVFLGIAIYSLEGILAVLPIEASLAKPNHAVPMFASGMAATLLLFSSFGVSGYLAGFGSCEVITECLPEGTLKQIIQIALIIALIFTHPVTLYISIETVEEILFGEDDKGDENLDAKAVESDAVEANSKPGCMAGVPLRWKRRLVRTPMAFITVLIAVFFKDFSLFTDLIGSLLLSTAGFIIPPLSYIYVFWGRIHIIFVAGYLLLAVSGVGIGLISTTTTVISLF